jgi:hypothetical protein
MRILSLKQLFGANQKKRRRNSGGHSIVLITSFLVQIAETIDIR